MISNIAIVDLLLTITAGLFSILWGIFIYLSLKESEPRAAGIFFLSGALFLLLYLLVLFTDNQHLKWLLLVVPYLPVFILLIPVGGPAPDTETFKGNRIDERDIMFSRRLLEEGTEDYNNYYSKYPERKQADDETRARPGFLSERSLFYDPLLFAAADASFETVKALAPEIDGPVSDKKISVSSDKVTGFIKKWGKMLGTINVGITPLRDYHLYSHRGRDHNYGTPVDNDHKFAIAFTVEMSRYMMDRAPKGPAIMESARKYMDAGAIAVQIAWFIRNLGYEARAHIDGNYEVVCPLVARDAGLGEIGRMGLLMTPAHGPRVRLGVVTTNLKLDPDKQKQDPTLIDFCNKCRKCATVCPSQSISYTGREIIDEKKRWQINQESCYDYWCSSGTDCGRCISVCPYAHPDNLLHRIVRYGIKRSAIFLKLAVPIDDLFYGKNPGPKELPDWMRL